MGLLHFVRKHGYKTEHNKMGMRRPDYLVSANLSNYRCGEVFRKALFMDGDSNVSTKDEQRCSSWFLSNKLHFLCLNKSGVSGCYNINAKLFGGHSSRLYVTVKG